MYPARTERLVPPAARFTERLKELIESDYGLFDSTVESELAGAKGDVL